MNFARTTNGRPVAVRDVPCPPVETFRRDIVDAVSDGLRIAGLFGQNEKGAGHPDTVRLWAVLADDAEGALMISSTRIDGGRYPSLTQDCPQAHLFEREIWESFGIFPEGHPWLKPVRYPRSAGRAISEDTAFFSAQGDEVHEVAVGPVHAGVIEPGHFRFQCHGETVMHLEIQLGYQHRGAENFLERGPGVRAAAVAESIAGDTAVGHALAYAELWESLGHCAVPPRAASIRGIALELERIANHVGDLAALCTDVGYLPGSAYLGRIRGEILNMLMELSGNRLGKSLIRPGGVLFDVPEKMASGWIGGLDRAKRDFEECAELMFEADSVQARFSDTGRVFLRAASDLGFVGPAARACGVERDVRVDHPHGIYQFAYIPLSSAPDASVMSRAMVRKLEVARSLEFVGGQIRNLAELPVEMFHPCGPPAPGQFSVSLVEGWRGEIAHVAMTDDHGCIARYKVKDPSFHNWPALALALRGTPISDFPLCNKSFNLSYAGHDL